MSLRTPSTTQNRNTLVDLQRIKERLALNNTRIATGKRITTPGDDPSGAAHILDFGTTIESNNQFMKQADSAMGYLRSAEDAINAAVDLNIQLQELSVQGTEANRGPSMVPQLDAIRTNLLALANTQVQGKYIFAGTMTQTAPFVDSAPPASPTYAGNSGVINVNVTASSTVATNIPGDQVFFGGSASSNMFQAIADLRDGFLNNDSVKIQAAADNLKTVMDNLNQSLANLGGQESMVINLKDTLSGVNLTLQELQGTIQDADYAQAMTDFTSDQTMQSVTLSTLAKTNKQNLFDYLS